MPGGNQIDGLPDLNGDGVADPWERYLAFRIWEEMNGIREEGEPEEEEPEQEGNK